MLSNKKRIMKNTIMLYIRMIVIMAVSLYISRIVLNVLGESDFGIYNVVGSVVISLVFIQNTLASATQRFLSYEIGKGDEGKIKQVYSMSINIQVIFMLIILILLETIGLWFVNRVLNIPENRMFAANVVYQLSIATFCINLLRIPYHSVIISFEKMNIYAVLSIVEAILKLFTAFLLLVINTDELIAYAIIVFVVTLIVNILYIIYCKRNICCIG